MSHHALHGLMHTMLQQFRITASTTTENQLGIRSRMTKLADTLHREDHVSTRAGEVTYTTKTLIQGLLQNPSQYLRSRSNTNKLHHTPYPNI